MASERQPLKLAVVQRTAPLRHWEARVLEHVLALEGVRYLGRVVQGIPERPRGRKLFHAFVQEANGSRMLAPEAAGTLDGALMADAAAADVILFFGGTAPTEMQRRSARCWCYLGPDDLAPEFAPPGTREALTERRTTYFALVDRSNAAVLRQGLFSTRLGQPMVTADEVLEHAACWAAQCIGDLLHEEGIRPVPDMAPASVPIPGNLSMWIKRLTRSLLRPPAADEGVHGDWNIGILHQPIHVLLDEEASANVRWLPPPSSDKARLEPFGYLAGDGELNVLYRKLDTGTGRSTIARLRPKPDNILKRSRPMLEIDRDHAYPYVLELDGRPHVLRTVRTEGITGLYRLNDGNDGFEPSVTLVNVALHAPTLFQHGGSWWLLGTQDPCADAALFIFHAPGPRGPFLPHAQNPVKCDLHSARPAGTPFMHEGVLWRPALDMSDTHHPAVVFNKVTALSPSRFAEEPGRLFDGFTNTAYGLGVRTLCAMGDVTLVDGLRSPVLSASEANASRSKRRKTSKKRTQG